METPGGASEVQLPTPTPFIYTIASGDTFFSIAVRFGIELDALLAANPGVDARFLSPGAMILIPAAGAINATALPSPTPVINQVRPPKCYSTARGELWCFVLVENDLTGPVENLIGIVQLLSDNGEVLATMEAVPPLNALAAGHAMPLVAYLREPPKNWASAIAQLLSAYSVAQDSQIYLGSQVQNPTVNISESGLAAQIVGEVQITGIAQAVWVLAVAYDDAGNVVGIRRWESNRETDFNFWVYSLGPVIAVVDLLVEARP